MIVPFRDILAERRQARGAVGAFTCYDSTTASGVLLAAEEASAPVILLVSREAFAGRRGELLTASFLALGAKASIAVCVQLDHVNELAVIKRAVKLGVGAIMADGSRLPLHENGSLVDEAVRLARSAGVGIEAELGHIEGAEDVAIAAHAGALTDPLEAEQLVACCQIDCLAVSIGNVHGTYASPPVLDWNRLESIRNCVDLPLSLHGASGLSATDLRTGVAAGIAKVNVNAELRRSAFDTLADRLSSLRDGWRMLELQDALSRAATDVATSVFLQLAGPASDAR